MLPAIRVLFLFTLVAVAAGGSLDFPPGFRFGAGSSAYQVEGAWNASDKGLGTWDQYARLPGKTADGGTGDEACDSFHQWKRDVEIAQELGLHFYRFSISWPRLLPTGLPDRISEDGKSYYNNLIDGLLAAGVQPLVTIYHMDLPVRFENMGGWTNPNIADWFSDYARVVYSLYADRVKTWITINEPVVGCSLGFGIGALAPGVRDAELAMYHCYKNQLLAHARAWRLYDEEFRHQHHGKVSLANQLVWYEPAAEGEEEIAELANEYINDICSHPVYSAEGGWPPEVEALVFQRSRREGLRRSRLPAFTAEEAALVRGTYDYYALNYYTARRARRARPGELVPMLPLNGAPELGAVFESDPGWEKAASYWFRVYPEGLRKLLRWVKERCSDPEVIITENGISTFDAGLDDQERVRFYRNHLQQVLLAIQEDKVNVTGFSAWSLMDSFEWGDGYTVKFGLYAVDFASPTRERTPRTSAKYYAKLIEANSLELTRRHSQVANSANRLGFASRFDL